MNGFKKYFGGRIDTTLWWNRRRDTEVKENIQDNSKISGLRKRAHCGIKMK